MGVNQINFIKEKNFGAWLFGHALEAFSQDITEDPACVSWQ